MRESIAKITDGGNAHLQAFVRPYTLIHASTPFSLDKPSLQEILLNVKFSVLDSFNFKNPTSCVPSLRRTLFAVNDRNRSRFASTSRRIRTQHGAISRDAKPVPGTGTTRSFRCRRDKHCASCHLPNLTKRGQSGPPYHWTCREQLP